MILMHSGGYTYSALTVDFFQCTVYKNKVFGNEAARKRLLLNVTDELIELGKEGQACVVYEPLDKITKK